MNLKCDIEVFFTCDESGGNRLVVNGVDLTGQVLAQGFTLTTDTPDRMPRMTLTMMPTSLKIDGKSFVETREG